MTEMSRGAEKREIAKKKRALLKQRYQPKSTGRKENVKTIYRFFNFIVLPTLIGNINSFGYEPGLTKIFFLPSVPYWGKLLILPW